MRNKVRKSLAFLLALALVVSVMSGLGLSVSAEQESNTPGTEEVQQQDKTEAGAAPSEVKAEEEAAKPEEKPVQEEKADEQKKQEETKTDDAAKDDANDQDGEQKQEEPKAEPAAEEPAEPVEKAGVPVVQAAAGEVDQYTISCGDQKLTVMLVDQKGNAVKGIAPKNLTIEKNSRESVDDYAADVKEYTYSSAYYYDGNQKRDVSEIAYYDNKRIDRKTYDGWYSVVDYTFYIERSKITNDTLYLVYTQNSEFNADFTVHYVDENGIEIGEKTKSISVENVRSIVFSDYADPIAGYTYWRACYSTANNAEITKAKKSTNYLGGSTYTFYNGSKKLSRPNNSSLNTEDINELNNVYLVYVKNGGDPTPGGTTGGSGTATATNTKKAMRNNDGTYDLSLTASGSVGTSENKAILDVIYVLDCSGSMKESMGQNSNRMSAAKEAITTMTNSLASNNKIKAQFSLVTFSYSANTKQGWTSSKDTLTNAMNGIKLDGATNYEAALTQAKSLLGSARTNASKVVVFVSDGIPTAYTSTGAYGGGDNDSDGRAMSRARGVVKTMTPNYLFTVGVGPEKNYSNLSEVTGAAHSGVKTANYAGTDSDELKAAFAKMEGTITSVACEDVMINDPLSENVEMVMENGAPKKLVGTVTGAKDGDVTNNADGTITLAATALNEATTLPAPTYSAGKIQWKFPAGYKLEADYTYTVTAKIRVTEEAYQNYRNNSNSYPDKADEETGTHAGKMGLYSNVNTEATLTYKQTGKSEYTPVNYAKPVVQLTPSKLTIKKTVTGLDNEALSKLRDNLKFTVTYTYADQTTKVETVSFSNFTLGDDDTYTYTSNDLDCWSMDATYTVVEDGFVVEGYDRTGGNTTVTGQIKGKNQDVTATFTNTYTPSNRTITLKKVVGGNMRDPKDEFTFTYGDKQSVTLNGGDNNTKEIEVPYGSSFTVTESDKGGYTLEKIEATGSTGTRKDDTYTIEKVTEDTTITFVNDKTIQPPNGIITTIAPYAIMVVLAAGAGVYFVYSRRRRNR